MLSNIEIEGGTMGSCVYCVMHATRSADSLHSLGHQTDVSCAMLKLWNRNRIIGWDIRRLDAICIVMPMCLLESLTDFKLGWQLAEPSRHFTRNLLKAWFAWLAAYDQCRW